MPAPGSAAIAIVRPSADQSGNSRSPPTKPATAPSTTTAATAPAAAQPSRQLCRNQQIYGKCAYQDSGCQFSHDPPGSRSPGKQQQPTTAAAAP